MESKDLSKIRRISETVRSLSAEAQKERREHLHSYKRYYIDQYNLVYPILYYDMKYQLEFQALRKPNTVSYTEIKPALVSLSTLIDSIIKEETLDNQQQKEIFQKEYFIEEGKPLSAYQQVTSVINQVVKTLKIVDNFMETSSLDFFLAVNTQAEIKVITKKLIPSKPIFSTARIKFISEWGGNNFEVKINDYFHDRFIIIDDTKVWHLGPSLNRLGEKPVMISMIRDEDIQKTIINIFNKQWEKSASM